MKYLSNPKRRLHLLASTFFVCLAIWLPAYAQSPPCSAGGSFACITADPGLAYDTDGSGLAVVTIFYNSPVNSASVYVDGTLFCSIGHYGSCGTGKWVRDGMVFTLKDDVTGVVLSSIRVSVLSGPAPVSGGGGGNPPSPPSCTQPAAQCQLRCSSQYNESYYVAQSNNDSCKSGADENFNLCAGYTWGPTTAGYQYCLSVYYGALQRCDNTYALQTSNAQLAENTCNQACTTNACSH